MKITDIIGLLGGLALFLYGMQMMSAGMEYKKEGPVYGIGSNIFKLAGTVILFGVVSSSSLMICILSSAKPYFAALFAELAP